MEKILESMVTESGVDAPYLVTRELIERHTHKFNPEFKGGTCDCGHEYDRHFDSWEDNEPVGCKYCECFVWNPPVEKAGLLPFVIQGDGTVLYAFMISSDPAYGGAKPQISKGHVDPEDEGSKAAAIREANEELGCPTDINALEEWSGTIAGMDGKYTMKIYSGWVKSRKSFVTPHFETKEVVWLTADEFQKCGREAHWFIVDLVDKSVKKFIKGLDDLQQFIET